MINVKISIMLAAVVLLLSLNCSITHAMNEVELIPLPSVPAINVNNLSRKPNTYQEVTQGLLAQPAQKENKKFIMKSNDVYDATLLFNDKLQMLLATIKQ